VCAFVDAPVSPAAEKEAGDDKVYLIIESPTHGSYILALCAFVHATIVLTTTTQRTLVPGIKKTFQFSSDTQVMEAMRQFNRFCKASNTSNYQLVIPPASSGEEEVVLDNMQRLHHYNFAHLVRIPVARTRMCMCARAV
jgi:hypothetical protein